MKVILNKDVYNLGEEGDVREVTPGYAQNYLIPNSMAVLFNKANIAMFEGRHAAIEKRKEEKRQNALSLKEKIESLELVISMPSGKSGKLFGSVTNATIVENLEKQGIKIERKKVDIPGHTVKSTGPVSVKIKLYGSDVAELKVVIKGEGVEEEAPAKKKAAPKVTKKEEPAAAEVETAVKERAVPTEAEVKNEDNPA